MIGRPNHLAELAKQARPLYRNWRTQSRAIDHRWKTPHNHASFIIHHPFFHSFQFPNFLFGAGTFCRNSSTIRLRDNQSVRPPQICACALPFHLLAAACCSHTFIPTCDRTTGGGQESLVVDYGGETVGLGNLLLACLLMMMTIRYLYGWNAAVVNDKT